MNRSAEIGWLVVRLLPFLQMEAGDFGDDWERKRLVLDDALRYMVQKLGELGKRIGTSFVTMVESKFAFEQPFHYFEANGSAAGMAKA